jgi:DNA repair protein RadC
MEGGGFFPFGGDPEDLLRGLREFAEQQAEGVKDAQREQFATLTLNTAVELTKAALAQVQTTGTVDEQALAMRDAMRILFPEAVALVSAARQGFMA